MPGAWAGLLISCRASSKKLCDVHCIAGMYIAFAASFSAAFYLIKKCVGTGWATAQSVGSELLKGMPRLHTAALRVLQVLMHIGDRSLSHGHMSTVLSSHLRPRLADQATYLKASWHVRCEVSGTSSKALLKRSCFSGTTQSCTLMRIFMLADKQVGCLAYGYWPSSQGCNIDD